MKLSDDGRILIKAESSDIQSDGSFVIRSLGLKADTG